MFSQICIFLQHFDCIAANYLFLIQQITDLLTKIGLMKTLVTIKKIEIGVAFGDELNVSKRLKFIWDQARCDIVSELTSIDNATIYFGNFYSVSNFPIHLKQKPITTNLSK